MNDYLYKQEFHISLDKECQKIVDSCYAILDKLKYYEDDCKFELPVHIQKLRKNLHNMLTTYEEN